MITQRPPDAAPGSDERESTPAWIPGLNVGRYDRATGLSAGERRALRTLGRARTTWPKEVAPALARLLEPIEDVITFVALRAQWWGRAPARTRCWLRWVVRGRRSGGLTAPAGCERFGQPMLMCASW